MRSAPERPEILERGRLVVDLNRMSARWDGQVVPLTLTELWILRALVRFPGHVKNRDQLMQEASVVVDDSTITSHIKRIRKKFLQVASDFACIETVYGLGYRWTCE